MTDRIPLVFAGGTGFFAKFITDGIKGGFPGFSIDLGGSIRWGSQVVFQGLASDQYALVPGLNGQTVKFAMVAEGEDPFVSLLDQNVWEPFSIDYPASMFGGTFAGTGGPSMGASINIGRDRMVQYITTKVPKGYPFALAGSSQGAAVCSSVYLMGLQPGTTGPLEDWRSGFLGYVGFGNPRRQRDYVSPYGVWSGSWDQPDATTGGGGAFPSTGQWRRLTNCEPDKWCEFANPMDIYSSNSASGKGALWTQAIEVFLDLRLDQIIVYLLNLSAFDVLGAALEALGELGKNINMVDALNRPFYTQGSGHASYTLLPPANSDGTYNATTITDGGKDYLKANTDSCLQLGLKFLNEKAAEYLRSPGVLPVNPTTPSTAGWSTTLVPPAA